MVILVSNNGYRIFKTHLKREEKPQHNTKICGEKLWIGVTYICSHTKFCEYNKSFRPLLKWFIYKCKEF